MMKKQSGITLIALVITIIVLLILAGVSLNLVLGNQGILSQATGAVDEHKKASIKEEVELLIAELEIEYYKNFATNSATYLTSLEYAKAKISTKPTASGVQINYDSTTDKFDYDGIEFVIDSNGNVTVGEQTGGGTPNPPTPEEPELPVQEPTKYTVSYNSNCEISAPESVEGEENDVINLPTLTREGYVFLGWAETQSATTAQYTNTFTVENSNVTLYAVWITTQSYNAQHPELHIPTGFQYKEGSWSAGYVITDSVSADKLGGNEFVWIPVARSEDYTKKLGTNNWWVKSGSTGSDTSTSLNNDVTLAVRGDTLGVNSILGRTVSATLDANQPEAEIVNSAGGFWVGRYEAGITNADHSNIAGINGGSSDSTNASASNEYWEGKKANIVVKQNSEPVRNITQTKALSIANGWKSGVAGDGTVPFQSGLITGSRVGCNV